MPVAKKSKELIWVATRRPAGKTIVAANDDYDKCVDEAHRKGVKSPNLMLLPKLKCELPKKSKKDGMAFQIDMFMCPRCMQEHERLWFYPFQLPGKGFTHYAHCPITREPLMYKPKGKK